MIGSKLTAKGQITIPKRIREKLNLEPGDRVLFIEREGEIVLEPVKYTLLDLRGSVKSKKNPDDFDDVRQTVKNCTSRNIASE